MKRITQLIMPFLLLGSCSSEDAVVQTPETDGTGAVAFSASISNGSRSRADESGSGTKTDSDAYLHNEFIVGRSRIRIVNTVNYSIPNFKEEGKYYEYINTKAVEDPNGGSAWDANAAANFFPYDPEASESDPKYVNNDLAFKWEDIIPTSSAYVFEAACYPMKYTPFDNVESDQRTQENFWSADLLLAHHAIPLSQINSMVKLRFWHVFCMVRATITLPIADKTADEGFPENALKSSYLDAEDTPGETETPGLQLNDMWTGYTTDYAGAIDNDASRTVRAVTGNGASQADIQMYPVSMSTNGEKQEQTYVYAAIVPMQTVAAGKTLVSLKINTIIGLDADRKQQVALRDYKFVPTGSSIEMRQGYITDLQLSFNESNQTPILIKAKVNPWNESYTDITLTPESTEQH